MGRIFSIEEFTTFDGPGIRVSVFLKGCPLSCAWCHNPEGQSPEIEYLRSPNGCLGCGACLRAGKEENGRMRLSAASVAACPRNLVRRSGDDYSPEELVSRLLPYQKILSMNEGGITFSGGEPLFQPRFLSSCLELLKGTLHTAVQTSGYASSESFDKVLALADYFLFDLKLMDPALHLQWCGAENRQIHRNYRALVRSGKPFVTRIPLIPGVTDTTSNLLAIGSFLQESGIRYAEVLPYNKLAGSKYAGLLRSYQPGFDEKNPIRTGEDLFARFGIQIRIL